MSMLNVLSSIALGFGVASAHAQGLATHPQIQSQPPPATDDAGGARPGHSPGIGQSLPLSNNASNNTTTDTTSTIAPTLPSTETGPAGTARAFLMEARAALVATGRTGQAQQALEMAETRSLDRVVPPDESSGPSRSEVVGQISAARRALANGDIVQALSHIDLALQNQIPSQNNQAAKTPSLRR
jgi:hypothetical protein